MVCKYLVKVGVLKNWDDWLDHVKVGRLGPFPRVSKPVFLTSAILLLAFIIFGAFFNELASEVFGQAKAFVSMRFGWFFIMVVNLTLVMSIYLEVMI